jgi:hypothetical protein
MPENNPPAMVWCAPHRVAPIRAACGALGVRVVMAGCSARGRSGESAAALDAEHAGDDLRAAVAGIDPGKVGLVILADEEVPSESDDLREAVIAAADRGVRFAALEPVPSGAADLTDPQHPGWLTGRGAGVQADVVPLGPGVTEQCWFGAFADAREHIGRIRAAQVLALGAGAHGSLGAHAAAGLEIALWLLGRAELVDASYTAPRVVPGLHPLPGQSLAGLTGDLSMLVRTPDGRSATIAASDQGGGWTRRVTVLAEGGVIELGERGFVWTGPGGAEVDRFTAPPPEGPSDPGSFTGVLARFLHRVLAGGAARPVVAPGPLLAAAHAALLSCRTGQAETPATFSSPLSAR